MTAPPETTELLALKSRLDNANPRYYGGSTRIDILPEDYGALLALVEAAIAGKSDNEGVREARIAKASALARRLCQLFDSGGESQRTVRARHASAIFQLLGSHEAEQRQCDVDPVCYLERCERLALSTTGVPER